MSTVRTNNVQSLDTGRILEVDRLVTTETELDTEKGAETLLEALDARWDVKANHATDSITLEARFSEVARPEDFGAIGDGVADDTAAIQAAIDTGKDVILRSRANYRIVDTLRISTPGQFFGGRAELFFDIQAGPSSDTRPGVWADIDAVGAKLFGFTLDHNGTEHEDIETRGHHLIWASGVFLEADDIHCDFVTVINGADNGIAVAQIDDQGVLANSKPVAVSVTNCRGKNNGCAQNLTELIDGVPTPRGRLGACVDIGTATHCIVSDCIDEGSYVGFIIDLGAGADCVMTNCYAFQTKHDFEWEPEGNSGLGFYIGGADSRVSNCAAFFCERDGFWVDTIAPYTNLMNCIAYSCGRHGFKIDNDFSSHVGLTAKLNGQNPNFDNEDSYGFFLDPNEGQYELRLISCNAIGHDYGVYTERDNCFAALILPGLDSNGQRIGVNNPAVGASRIGALQADGGYFSFGHRYADTNLHVFGSTEGATTWGDLDNNGQLFVSPDTSGSKRLVMAYAEDSDRGVIQAVEAGVSNRRLMLNPNGGDVQVGLGTYDNALILNGHWLWVDSSNRLRILQGPPSSDTDGVVVGTQS